MITASIHILYTYHDTADRIEDGTMVRAEANIRLIHEPTDVVVKGTIYANACSTCGAPQKDSIAHTCVYCGAILSDVTREWIVGGLSET